MASAGGGGGGARGMSFAPCVSCECLIIAPHVYGGFHLQSGLFRFRLPRYCVCARTSIICLCDHRPYNCNVSAYVQVQYVCVYIDAINVCEHTNPSINKTNRNLSSHVNIISDTETDARTPPPTPPTLPPPPPPTHTRGSSSIYGTLRTYP